MTERAERLRAHIDAAQGAPVIGADDCGPWVASWIERETGKRLIFPPYKDSEQAYAMAAEAGGMVEFVSPMMSAIGLWETSIPELGDVGIIRLSDRDTAAIFCGNGVVVIRDERLGSRYMQVRGFLKAWSVP